MSDDLHLAGVAERTRKGYLRPVRQLAEHAKCSPDKIDEEQLRQWLLHLKVDKQLAYGSLRVAFSGIKFFFTRTCKRNWMHFVVPGGGVSADGSRWLQTPAGFLFPAKAAAAFYKQQFVDHLRQSGLYDQMPYGVLKKN